MAKSKKQFGIGGVPKPISDAIADWKEKQFAPAKTTRTVVVGGYVSALPAPPEPGTTEWQRCIYLWYAAYVVASRMDDRLVQNAADQVNLNACVIAYGDCMIGD